MPGEKLQSADEFRRWWDEGRTYQWIINKYREKYGIDVTLGAIGNWRARLGLERRQQRNMSLIPWEIEEKHRYRHVLAMLRAEGRRRAGAPLARLQEHRLESWLHWMSENDCVVHYDPETDEGFHYVPRRSGVDADLVRTPLRSTRRRHIRE